MARDRDLRAINKKLFKGTSSLQALVRQRLEASPTVSVLEIGCGTGRALMELALEFRRQPVQFFAINKERGKPLDSAADLPREARDLGVAWDGSGPEWPIPELFFEDATRMHFEDETFDLVFASSVLRFVPHKAELLEEIARVLKPGGVAVVRVSGKGWDYPHERTSGDRRLTSFPARWVLQHDDELVPLDAGLALASGGDFTIEIISQPNCVIRLTKHARAALRLGWRYVDSLSVPLREIGYGDDDRGLSKGGVRSVYDVPDAQYQQLVERGLLATVPDREPSGRGRHDTMAWSGVAAALLVLPGASRFLSAFGGALHHVRHADWSLIHVLSRFEWSLIHRLPRLGWEALLFVGVLGALPPKRKRERLESYRVGQRVNIKGRRRGQRFRAAKIKAVHRQVMDHLEGPVEWVAPHDHALGLFGVTAVLVDRPMGSEARTALSGLRPGTPVRVRGTVRNGHFLAGEVRELPASAILVEEIQAPIEMITPTRGVLRVAGVSIATDQDTKIDRLEESRTTVSDQDPGAAGLGNAQGELP